MVVLVVLTILVLVASIAATTGFRSRSEAVVVTSLLFNALIVGPIYVLGLANQLDRVTLGIATTLESLVVLGLYLRPDPRARALALVFRILELVTLPIEAIRKTWAERSLLVVGVGAATLIFPYMLLIAYLAPAWRDWDALWYHEPITGFTIQNHGFAPVPLPMVLQVVNGVQRLGEMTQLWFAIYAGRQLVDVANVVFMPLLAASMYALAHRYTRDAVTSIALASSLVLLPGFLRVAQSTMVDPQGGALLLAAAYWVTHPQLGRRAVLCAILGLTLAVGTKIWSIVPAGLLSLFLLVRILRRRREIGNAWTAGLLLGGTVSIVGMQMLTYLRNWILYKNPLWPMISYDNARLGIHWKGAIKVDPTAARAGINFNDPYDVFWRKMTAAPYTVLGPGHSWQVNDYGFAWAWIVFPLAAFAVILLALRWSLNVTGRITRLRARSPEDDATSTAMMLAVPSVLSLYLSPALFIARYHVAAVGMLLACLCWMVGTTRFRRLVADAALFAQIGSLLLASWVPNRGGFLYLFAPEHVIHWLRTPFPDRELLDIKTHDNPKLLISPVNGETGRAREREVKENDIVAFDYIDFIALLWNNAYSNKVVWLDDTADPLGQAEKIGAVWVYTRGGTTLAAQLSKAHSDWELVGPLEAEGFGNAWRRKKIP